MLLNRSTVVCVLAAGLIGGGCVTRITDVTDVKAPKYESVSGKAFETLVPLFLVRDHGKGRSFLFGPHPQDFPFKPSDFTGEPIPVEWSRRTFVTDVLEPRASFVVKRIEYVQGPTMCMDRIHALIMTPPYAGELLEVEFLFHQSDRANKPIRPRSQYIKEIRTGE